MDCSRIRWDWLSFQPAGEVDVQQAAAAGFRTQAGVHDLCLLGS